MRDARQGNIDAGDETVTASPTMYEGPDRRAVDALYKAAHFVYQLLQSRRADRRGRPGGTVLA